MTSAKLSSGFNIPLVGLGTWQSQPGEVGEAVIEAIRAGYRHIDCASIYGNEKEIGSALKKSIEDLKIVKREDLFITTKLWNTKHHPSDVIPALKGSLDDLQLDYLDLYLIHWPISFKRGGGVFPQDEAGNLIYDDVDHLDTWKEMEKSVSSGLVRSIGLSNFNSVQIENVVIHSTIKPSVLQVEVHPYLNQERLVEYCRGRNIVVTAYSSLAASYRQANHLKDENLLGHPILVELAAKYDKTSAQIVLRWLVQRGIVVIPKSVKSSRIVENIKVFDFELSDGDMAEIAQMNKNLRFILPMVVRDGKQVPRDEPAPNYPFIIEF